VGSSRGTFSPSTVRRRSPLWTYPQLSYAEIAEALAVPVGTVRSRLHRARGKIRTRLDDRWLSAEETA
jgi:RNA polymerase sigma-70 factor (ECF subfamily)